MVNKAFAGEIWGIINDESMIKDQIVIDLTADQIHLVCETFVTLILNKVKNGEDVTLTNVLKFERVLNEERTFKIPNKDKTTTKPAHYSMKVKVMAGVKTAFEEIPVETEKPKKVAAAKKAIKADTDSEAEPELPLKNKAKGKVVAADKK
jgi:nucleoid DNA-binding protein